MLINEISAILKNVINTIWLAFWSQCKQIYNHSLRGCYGRDHMVVGFTITVQSVPITT